MVCQGQTSRLAVCTELLKLLNLESTIKINVVQSDYFNGEYFAPRPGSEILINKKLDLKNMNRMSPWKDALNEYLHRSFPLLINRK
jgi:dTDP-4-dehydrorhamnose reductase